MRALVVAVLLAAVSAAFVHAYEIEGNPDRKLSVGLHFDHGWNNSDYSVGALKINDFAESKANVLGLDARIPLSHIFTFSVRGGFGKTTTDSWLSEKIETSEKSVGFSIRAYFP